MTDIDWTQLEADREAGTPGPWRVGANNPTQVIGPDSQPVITKDPPFRLAEKQEANARRIACLPALEAYALAAREKLEAAERLVEACWKFSAAIDDPMGRPGSARIAMLSALAAYRAAGESKK